ncbi:hypothetical protein BUALT_Bualt05G0037600 [Buddleja alternifolia]|nr:hypothetical protein BUALT_Bualt05G0037600 [Buddleja alternifolia]
MHENPNRFNAFMSPSNSSSSNFNNPQVGNVDKISSVVSMLKGTLERKKLNNQVDKEAIEDSSFGYEEFLKQYENHGNFQDALTFGVTETGAVLQTIEESLMEGIMDPVNTNQMSIISREPSQSESSTAPPFINGFDMCEDPSVSTQAPNVCESSRNQMGNGRSPEDSSRTKDFKERLYNNSKDDQKKGGLIRHGSVTSAGSGNIESTYKQSPMSISTYLEIHISRNGLMFKYVYLSVQFSMLIILSYAAERGDPTKKRRVERSRKMAEAKERSSSPAVPSDTQSILKRCENLEKEVRSLKLNLAFMNRKDSEQTKQIEELQKQNQDLADEKERLLEEIERIIADTGKM